MDVTLDERVPSVSGSVLWVLHTQSQQIPTTTLEGGISVSTSQVQKVRIWQKLGVPFGPQVLSPETPVSRSVTPSPHVLWPRGAGCHTIRCVQYFFLSHFTFTKSFI